MEMISSIDVNLRYIDERQITLMTSIDGKIFDASVMTHNDDDDIF